MTKFVDHGVPFYHGTVKEFQQFRPLSHFGSREVAVFFSNQNHSHEEVIELHQEMMGKVELQLMNFQQLALGKEPVLEPIKRSSPKIIPVHLNLTNTYELQDSENHHDYNCYKNTMLYHFMIEKKFDQLPPIFDFIFDDPKHLDHKSVRDQLQMDSLYAPAKKNLTCFSIPEIDMYHLCFQRMIQYWESAGYDGFHYTNCHEDNGHLSYVPFRPESIKRLDLNSVRKTQKPQQPNSAALAKIRDNYLNQHQPRDLMPGEEMSLDFMNIYYREIEHIKSKVASKNDIIHRPQFIRHAIKSKAYYAQMFIQEIMPELAKITAQPRYGYHGLTHTEQVAMYGIDCAIAANQDPLPVILAAGLHDCARKNDAYCERHGPDCEPITRQFLKTQFPNLNPLTVEKIVYAVVNHTTGMNAPDMVSACLWDADRIRLSWEEVYRPEFFSTVCGQKIAGLSPSEQSEYIQRQDAFLLRHKIKTREEIEYERAQAHVSFFNMLDIENKIKFR